MPDFVSNGNVCDGTSAAGELGLVLCAGWESAGAKTQIPLITMEILNATPNILLLAVWFLKYRIFMEVSSKNKEENNSIMFYNCNIFNVHTKAETFRLSAVELQFTLCISRNPGPHARIVQQLAQPRAFFPPVIKLRLANQGVMPKTLTAQSGRQRVDAFVLILIITHYLIMS
jgi:hypothetical protein